MPTALTVGVKNSFSDSQVRGYYVLNSCRHLIIVSDVNDLGFFLEAKCSHLVLHVLVKVGPFSPG